VDGKLFFAVNQGMRNSFFDLLMPAVSNYDLWIPIGVVILLFITWEKPRKGIVLFFTLIVAVALSDMINHRILKEIFARVRPCHVLSGVHLLSGCGKSFSFPSSHAVNSFTIAMVIGMFDKRLLAPSLLSASLVALSRVYLGVHYVSDVTAGAFFGVGFAYLAYKTTYRFAK